MVKARSMYSVLAKRLSRIVAAARQDPTDKTDRVPTNNLFLRRTDNRLQIAATNGSVLVVADVAADKSLFESGQELVLPRSLIDSLTKARGPKDDPVEIVDEGKHIVAHMPNGIEISSRKTGVKFPKIAPLLVRHTADCTAEIPAENLRVALKAILAACDCSTLTFKLRKDDPTTLVIEASDDDTRIMAVIAGAETTIVEDEEAKRLLAADKAKKADDKANQKAATPAK